MICALCDEEVETDSRVIVNAPSHRECAFRSVMGGIGHHIAHEYWCLILGDPDAGLTFRQSALMVWALKDVIGVDELAARAVV